MYNRGDKGGTTHSTNMMSDQVATQMAAFEQRGEELEENQYKMADALQQLVARGDTTIGSNGGIPLVIETKSSFRFSLFSLHLVGSIFIQFHLIQRFHYLIIDNMLIAILVMPLKDDCCIHRLIIGDLFVIHP